MIIKEQSKMLNPESLTPIRSVDERMVSYNIEMTEVTGGTFWKACTPGQIAGTEEFPPLTATGLKDITAMAELMEYYPPIDLYNEQLRSLAKELGPAWIRVSGSWATKTYYDFDGETGGSPSDLSQTKKIFDFSHAYGVDINAAEFMNEPNMLAFSGAPMGYTPKDYARDQDIFFGWVRQHYPNCLLVGPCATGDPSLPSAGEKSLAAGLGSAVPVCTTQALMDSTTIRPDVFSYHYYNGISERGASFAPNTHWSGNTAHTDAYLSVAPDCARDHTALRDKYVPGGQIWVTESGDAGAGGNTWASTYLDVLRTLNELGTFAPRSNYFAVWLWNRLMGTAVYDCENPNTEGAHIYCHSRRDGKEGVVFLVINNSLTEATTVHLPKQTQQEGNIELAPGSCTFFVL